MFTIAVRYSSVRKCVAMAAVVSVLMVASAFARTADKQYEVELVVTEGKKSVETDAVLSITETSFKVEPDKKSFKSSAREFTYANLKTADYSFSKKPMLSGGGAVATAILLGVFVVPFLFMKKKNHWMSLQTEKEFVVIKLGDRNHRQIVAEFETHGVKVNTVNEESKKKGE